MSYSFSATTEASAPAVLSSVTAILASIECMTCVYYIPVDSRMNTLDCRMLDFFLFFLFLHQLLQGYAIFLKQIKSWYSEGYKTYSSPVIKESSVFTCRVRWRKQPDYVFEVLCQLISACTNQSIGQFVSCLCIVTNFCCLHNNWMGNFCWSFDSFHSCMNNVK